MGCTFLLSVYNDPHTNTIGDNEMAQRYTRDTLRNIECGTPAKCLPTAMQWAI